MLYQGVPAHYTIGSYVTNRNIKLTKALSSDSSLSSERSSCGWEFTAWSRAALTRNLLHEAIAWQRTCIICWTTI